MEKGETSGVACVARRSCQNAELRRLGGREPRPSPRPMYASPKFKNDDIISAKSSFNCFLFRMRLGGRGGEGEAEEACKKSTFCTLVKMMKKMDKVN